MITVINQFKRLYYPEVTSEQIIQIKERRLKWSLENLKFATDELLRTSKMLHDLVHNNVNNSIH